MAENTIVSDNVYNGVRKLEADNSMLELELERFIFHHKIYHLH